MAKRKKKTKDENKSEIIRAFITANPGLGPKEIAASLNDAHSWNITPAYVSTVKHHMGVKPKTASAAAQNGVINPDDLVALNAIVKSVGGIENAQLLLGTLSKLLA